MNDIIGIAWYGDEIAYNKALEIFTDVMNMPDTYKYWKAIVDMQCKEIKDAGNIALRVDIDPVIFKNWCNERGFLPNAQGRTAFVKHAEIEHEKTGNGIIIE